MRKLGKHIGFILTTMLLLNCSHHEDETSNMDLITLDDWHITSAIADPPIEYLGFEIVDIINSAFVPECIKDNIIDFNSDGSYYILDGNISCSKNSDPMNGTWEFSPDETKLNLDYYTDSAKTLDILDLTSEYLRIIYTGEVGTLLNMEISDTNIYKVTVSYKH